MKIKNFIRGDSRAITVTVLDANGAAINLTGGKLFFTLSGSSSPDDDSGALISKTMTSFTNPTQGIHTFSLASSDTNTILPGEYNYDVQFVDGAGNVTSKQQDTFEIIADITRRTT